MCESAARNTGAGEGVACQAAAWEGLAHQAERAEKASSPFGQRLPSPDGRVFGGSTTHPSPLEGKGGGRGHRGLSGWSDART